MNHPRPAPFNILTTLYEDAPMATIWCEEASISAWLEVEGALAEAQAEFGLIPDAEAAMIKAACRVEHIDRARLWREARNVGYPILPLVRQISQRLPAGSNGRVHFGATTQDIMDTGIALQLRATCERLEQLLVSFGDALQQLVLVHGEQVMAGRTHGQHAVPTTLGAKMAVFLDEITHQLRGLRGAGRDLSCVSLYGAAGTSAALGDRAPEVRAALARRLGLANCEVPWHVSRGRIAHFGSTLATIAAVCARFAREVIDLSRTEIAELREQSGHHRGASSTMPQKANPISSESVVGFAITATSSATSLFRAVEAGHERSAGEWQIEWVALPTISVMTASAVALCVDIAVNLQVDPEAMEANLGADGGLIMSEAVMMRLAGVLGREKAHDVVYAAATRARRSRLSLLECLSGELPPGLVDTIGPISANEYLGGTGRICDAANLAWIAVRDEAEQRKELV